MLDGRDTVAIVGDFYEVVVAIVVCTVAIVPWWRRSLGGPLAIGLDRDLVCVPNVPKNFFDVLIDRQRFVGYDLVADRTCPRGCLFLKLEERLSIETLVVCT